MKRKIYLLLMSFVMCSSVFFSGCGRQEDMADIVSEEKETDDKEATGEPDETDGIEVTEVEVIEEKPEKPPYHLVVSEIYDDAIENHIRIFLEGKEAWIIPHDEAVLCDEITYSLSDLNYNGRSEIIVTSRKGTDNISTVDIYEINETRNGFDHLEWEFEGFDKERKFFPDMGCFSVVYGYYDKYNGVFHYLFKDYYADFSGRDKCRYCDVSFVDGKVVSEVYAKSESEDSGHDEDKIFTEPNGVMSEKELSDYKSSFNVDSDISKYWMGLIYGYSAGSTRGCVMEDMSDDEIIDMLTDSFHLFAGKIHYTDFYTDYLIADKPWQTSEGLFNEMIGRWGVYKIEDEELVVHSSSDLPGYILEVFNDRTINISLDPDSYYVFEFDPELRDRAEGMLFSQLKYTSRDIAKGYNSFTLTFITIDEEGHLIVMFDTWNGKTYDPWSIWYFERTD